MIFNYDPITGLNYYSYPNNTVMIDLTALPEDTDAETVLELIKRTKREMGILLIDSNDIDLEGAFHYRVISNVPYFE